MMRFHHMGVFVSDLDEARKLWVDLLGFTVTHEATGGSRPPVKRSFWPVGFRPSLVRGEASWPQGVRPDQADAMSGMRSTWPG